MTLFISGLIFTIISLIFFIDFSRDIIRSDSKISYSDILMLLSILLLMYFGIYSIELFFNLYFNFSI